MVRAAPLTLRHGAWPAVAVLLCAGWAGTASAQAVSLAGSMGADKALLMVDGQPLVLAVGATARGITLRRLEAGLAEVDVAGQRSLLLLGATPAQLGGTAAAPQDQSIVLPAGSDGHFMASGSINGRSVQFMVDTGATSIALGQQEADRIGLDWQRAPRSLTQTANGVVPVHSLSLRSVRVGNVELANVAAVVIPVDMPMVLLGNSFLSRFSMRRDGDVMRLDKRH